MYLDIKFTGWERRYFNENASENKVLDILEKNKKLLKQGTTPQELEDMISSTETIYEVQTPISVEENDGDSTVEMYDNEHKLIWNNT